METSLLKIINHYGIEHQQRKLEEEVFELQEAIVNIRTYDEFARADMNVFYTNREFFKKHVAEELGDVMNVLEEIRLHYEISKEQVEENRKPKIERQLERIEKGE